MSIQQSRQQEAAKRFEEFLRGQYWEEVLELARSYPRDQKSLYVDWGDIFRWDDAIADDYLTHPELFTDAAEDALAHVDIPVDIDLEGAHVRLTDESGMLETRSVADLRSDDIGDFVAVHGIMDKVTDTASRAVELAYVCQRCGDVTVVPQTRHQVQDPYQCVGCEREGPFKWDVSRSEFVDVRKIKLKQPPEEAGETRGEDVTVYVEDDLVDTDTSKTFPEHAGERITVYGVYRLQESDLHGRNADTEADGWLEARSIEFEEAGFAEVDVEKHVDEIEALQDRPFDTLIEDYAASIAPTIEPDEQLQTVLEGAVAWLFNGYRIDVDQRGSFRGDLHMGIIGDPGRGKSKILSNLDEIAPKSEFRSATGFSEGSGVPLTAAAVQEEFAGQTEWTLNPGILPRANGGHCIIDEIDDAVSANTKKLHDAIEGEQILKVDKAGIKADLYSRTPLLVSGNPEDGRFDPYESIAEQVDMDPALVSRMDLLFALESNVDPEFDESVAESILESFDELSRFEAADQTTTVDEPDEAAATERPIDLEAFRAAVHHARQSLYPILTEPAKQQLKDFYVETRDINDREDIVPITARKLEAGIRIAVGFARADFSQTVEPRHAEKAIELSKKVIGLNFDPETGQYDAGITDEGTPRSQKERRKQILVIVDDLDEEMDDAPARKDIISAAKAYDLDPDKVDHDLDKLAEQGDLYKPKTGRFLTT